MNRKDRHVGHAAYRAAGTPEFVETLRASSFTTVDVADVSLQTRTHLRRFHSSPAPSQVGALTTSLNQRLAILARETGMAMATLDDGSAI